MDFSYFNLKCAPSMQPQRLDSVYRCMHRVVRKPFFCICENKDADQLRGTAKLISAFVFATWIVQFLFYLNPKIQASSHLLWLYSPVCVGPGQKPGRPVFSQRGSYVLVIEIIYAGDKKDLDQPCLDAQLFCCSHRLVADFLMTFLKLP